VPTKFPALLLLAAVAAFPQTPAVQVSSYLFQNTLDAQRPGSPALTAVDPLGRNNFRRDVVLGQERFVYETGGTATPLASQAGLTYRAAGLLPRENYSIEILFTFTGAENIWRRIYSPDNRAAATGLYLDPSGWFDYYSGVNSLNKHQPIRNGTYSHIVIVKRPGEIDLYLNGQLVGSRGSGTLLGLMTPALNPDQIVALFLDDNNEYANARIALFRTYSGNLTATEVADIYKTPFTSTIGLPKPALTSSGIVNSASYSASNAISPGGFFSIFGANLGEDMGDWGQSFVNNIAPKRLNNVRVLINDIEAFVVFTSPGQVNALAPDNIPEGPVNVVVEYGNIRSTTVPTQSRRINPAMFRYSPQDNRYLAATANDGSAFIAPPNLFGTNGVLNGLAIRPARPGEFVVLYATGLGPTTPNVPAGQIPPARTGGHPLANPSEVRLTGPDGQTRTVVPAYSGLSGFPGLHQIVFQAPDAPTGDYETTLVVNGQSSPTRVYLPIAR
jgi:uncharacterized protein (TIGR03437 family)